MFYSSDPVLADTQRAVEILARYQGSLQSPAEQPLQVSIEKVVHVFQSELFQALLGKGALQLYRAKAPGHALWADGQGVEGGEQ